MSEPGSVGEVLVQVLPVDDSREIGWGSSRVAVFRDRLADVREAVVSGAGAVADSLDGLPSAEGWRLHEVSGSFGISLTAEGGVILTKATAGTTFEITVTFQHADRDG
jgi:Trypsin-co-occurring domain 1